MTTRTVIKHALIQGERVHVGSLTVGMTVRLMWSDAPRLVEITYVGSTVAQGTVTDGPDVGRVVPLHYSDHMYRVALTRSARPLGVSLAKITDRPNGVIMVPSEGELDRRRGERGVDVDAELSEWTVAGLDCNDLRYLSRAFAVLGRFNR